MVYGRRPLLTLGALGFTAALLSGAKFYPDDPIWREPPPIPVTSAVERSISDTYEMLDRVILRRRPKRGTPARAINTLGEVPDSAWFRNRYRGKPRDLASLVRGPIVGESPEKCFPWTVVRGKNEGASPGFVIDDCSGVRFILKFDSPQHPNITTAAEVIGSKFFHALGYHVPEYRIVRFDRSNLTIGPRATVIDATGKKRPMTPEDLEEILLALKPESDGRFRAVASRFIEGKILGPFLYSGTRSDDPNDIVPHEDRRDLRGLFVFSSWLNHFDTSPVNTLDSLVVEDGIPHIRHHLIDFGSTLGSDALGARRPESGNSYLFEPRPVALQLFTGGIFVPGWQKARYPIVAEAGRFDWKSFDPRRWKPVYPNPAFHNMLPDDAYWAAKKVMEFSDEEIRAMVETGEYGTRAAVDWISECLIERRNKIGRAYFSDVLPLDDFRVEDGELRFWDLAVKYGFVPARVYEVRWFRFDNLTERRQPLPDPVGYRIPPEFLEGSDGYVCADLWSEDPAKRVTAYLRKEDGRIDVVGLERSW